MNPFDLPIILGKYKWFDSPKNDVWFEMEGVPS